MPAGATYEPIATATGNGTTATVTFSSISSGYTDLVIISSVLSTTAQFLRMRFNGDSGTNYSQTAIYGDGTSASSTRTTSSSNILVANLAVSGFSSTNPCFSRAHIFSYAGSTNKSILSENAYDQNGTGEVNRSVGLWRSTSAITSIELYATAGAFSTSSTFTLYGIKNSA